MPTRPDVLAALRGMESIRALVLSAALPALAASAAWAPSTASADEFEATPLPNLRVERAPGAITIDGDLNDAGWANAARASGFCEARPGDQTKPSVDTEVLVTYDDANFYLAFIAQDDPAAIRSSLRARDEIFREDFIGIILDTFGDAAMQYEFFCNPIGIQGDLRATSNDEDSNFNLVWESMGKITATGYQVEVAVPFKSLRFPNQPEQVWRANFWRTHPRDSRRQYSWAAIDRDDPCFPCQFGTLTGITGIRPTNDVEILPSLVGFQSGALRDDDDPASGFDNEAVDGDVSLGMRYAITSNLAGEATLNPDFSQIESDAAQIDVNTTFALFFPERRPFFQDGSNLFQTWFDAVYTRSMNDPSVAAKVTGQVGRTSVAYVGARDEHSPIILPFEDQSEFLIAGKSTSNVLRVKQTIMQDSFLGALVTDRRLDGGGSGTLFGADGSVRFLRNYRFELQGLLSRSREPNDASLTEDVDQETFDDGDHTSAFDGERFWGNAVYASIERSARVWNLDFDYRDMSPTFRADNGFITQNDRRMASGWTGLHFRRNLGFVEQIEPSINLARVWNHRGLFKDEWVRPQIWMQFKGQTNCSIAYLASRERFRDLLFPGIRRLEFEVRTDAAEVVSGGFEMATGRSIARRLDTPVLGRGATYAFWGEVKPVNRLVIAPEVRWSNLDYPDGRDIFEGYIARTRINYQFTRELFMRLVLQYDHFDQAYDVEPLVSYVINPFTVFYLGSTHAYSEYDDEGEVTETARQFFLKLQYLFRV